MSTEIRHPETGRVIPRLRFWLDGGYDRFLVEECEYHPDHRWVIVRVGDVEEHAYDPDELMVICKGCFVPRCGHTTEENPCMLPRHHRELHICRDGSTEDATVWPGDEKPPAPDIDHARPDEDPHGYLAGALSRTEGP